MRSEERQKRQSMREQSCLPAGWLRRLVYTGVEKNERGRGG